MSWVRRCIWVIRPCNDPVGQRAEALEQAMGFARRAKEAEVVAKHDDRVKGANRFVTLLEREQPHIANSAPTCHLDRTRRYIDPDDAPSTPLQFQGRSPSAHASIKHPPAHPTEGATLYC